MHLVEHLGSTTDNYRCNRCLTENKFAKMDDYRRHFLLCHTDILYRCEVCLKVFTQQSTYEVCVGKLWYVSGANFGQKCFPKNRKLQKFLKNFKL